MEIVSIAISKKKGTRKVSVPAARLIQNHGIEGDAHAGPWHRQVSFLAAESIETARDRGLDVTFGDFAENIATRGIDWKEIPLGARIRLGESALVQITQIGKECHTRCAIYRLSGDCIMPGEGIFGRVLRGGKIHCGDQVGIVDHLEMKTEKNTTEPCEVLHCEKGACRDLEQELIGEDPLLIRIEDRPYSVVMRTPGEEIFHAAGFCLAEGLVDRREDFATIDYCREGDPNVISVSLQRGRAEKVAALLERRGFVSQTSCGICGKELIEDICQLVAPVKDNTRLRADRVVECAGILPDHQNLHKRTRSCHAAMLVDPDLKVVAAAEDVGRHNALDKAIGKALMTGRLAGAGAAILSSRLSFELVQKGGRARLPVLISISRPTALAVRLGRALNMTLACMDRDGGLLVFCGRERIDGA